MAVRKLGGFPGFGIDYDKDKQPMFEALVLDALFKLGALPTGREILHLIKDARPGYRANTLPAGVNVVFYPTIDRKFVPDGMRADGTFKDGGTGYNEWKQEKGCTKLIPLRGSKTESSADSGDTDKSAKYTGVGSSCFINYSNTEILSATGQWQISYITMGHELIHCVHMLYGMMLQPRAGDNGRNKPEEWFTVGIKGFEDAHPTENALRRDANLELRERYFTDD
jgi:hypothetical protein